MKKGVHPYYSYFLLFALLVTLSVGCKSGQSSAAEPTPEKKEKTTLDKETVLSASTKLLLNALSQSNGKVTPAMKEKFGLLEQEGKSYVKSTLKVADQNNTESKIEGLGGIVQSKSGEVWTALLPIDSLQSISELGELSYLEVDTKSITTK